MRLPNERSHPPGVVVSDKMDKTVVVNVARRKQHALSAR